MIKTFFEDLRLAREYRKFEGMTKKNNPLVEMWGYEKTMGKTQPHDFAQMVQNYQSWVYACVNRNAFSVAKTDLKIYKKVMTQDGDDYQEILTHPFLDLMTKVNPFFNRFELWCLTVIFLELTGNAYWWLVKNPLGVPIAIWNIPAHWMQIIPSKTEFIAGYVMQQPGSPEKVPFSVEDIIHFKYPSPFSLYYGCPPMYAAAYDVDINRELKAHGVSFLLNNATPGGVLYTDERLGDKEYKRLRDMWNMRHKGSSNAGKIAVLEAGLKYEKTGSNLAELQFSDTSRNVRDAILAIFGVPASQLGLVEDVNRANAEANEYVYQNGTILPKLKLIEEKLNEKMMPIYDVNLICEFDNVVPMDKDFRLREQTEHIRAGYSSIDDERAEDGKDPYDTPETTMPLIPFSLMPAGSPKPEPVDPNTISDEKPEDEKKSMSLYDTKAKRARKWEVFIAMTTPQIKHMGNVMTRFFEHQHRTVSDNINKLKAYPVKAGVGVNIIFNSNEENERLRNMVRTYIEEAVKSGVALGYNELNSALDWNMMSPNILRSIERRIFDLPKYVNDGTAQLLNDAIAEGVKLGESIDKIADRVNEIYNYSERFRAVRIAQTEVIGAANEGQLLSYVELGADGKEWITANDERVRESHQIDGQTVGVTESFTLNSGVKLQMPGERHAPVEEIVNCRCNVAPVIKMKG
jgi:HK97 family phage portal protein